MNHKGFIYTWASNSFKRNAGSFAIVSEEGYIIERSDKESRILFEFFRKFYPRFGFRVYWIGESIIDTKHIIGVYKRLVES